MSKKILIDASQPTETRIALIKNDKLEECEIETNSNNRIKNNVYLAKITRVEASLQAAFVDFGLKKHGFLPFTEIHPDYFKIPVADQKKLKELISIDEEVLEEEKNLHKEKNSENISHEIENNFVENDSSRLNKEMSHTNREKKVIKKDYFLIFLKSTRYKR